MTTQVTTTPAPATKTSFFKKIKNFFKKIFGSTKFEKTVSATLSILGPLIETVVGLVGGTAAETVVSNLVSEIQQDLAVASAIVDDVNLQPTLPNILTAIKENLSEILSSIHVTDSATQTKITIIVNTLIGEIEAIETEFNSGNNNTTVASSVAHTATVNLAQETVAPVVQAVIPAAPIR